MANNTLIGALRAEATLESGKFVDGARKIRQESVKTENAVKKSFNGMATAIKGFGGAVAAGLSFGALAAAAKIALDYAASLKSVSAQLGVTTGGLQELRYAATQNGVKVAELDKGLENLKLTLGKVAAGATAPTKALEGLRAGLSKDVQGKDTATAFKLIAEELSKIPDPAKRAAFELALFQEAGSKLDPLLSKGSAAINELATAARELGVVLSDEQIQRADETAKKLEQVKLVLAAQISGIVADNAQSITTLAGSLATLTGEIVRFLGSNPMAALAILGALAGGRVGGLPGAAAGAFAGSVAGAKMAGGKMPPESKKLLVHNLRKERDRIAAIRKGGGRVRKSDLDRLTSLTAKVDAANGTTPSMSFDMPQFLAPKPKSGSRRRGRTPRDNSEALTKEFLRKRYEMEREELEGKRQLLDAQASLSHDYQERADIARQSLQIEHDLKAKEIEFNLAMIEADKTISDSQKEEARQRAVKEHVLNDQVTALRLQAINEDEILERQEQAIRDSELIYSIQRDLLGAQRDLATTADERRRIELDILNLAYRERKERLERIIRDSKDADERRRAQMELNSLPSQYQADRAGVMQSTRGPFEQWQADALNTSDAMEQLKIQGIEGAVNALMALTEGFDSFKDAALSAVKAVIAELIRMQLIKMAAQLFGAATGTPVPTQGFTGPAFATGGFTGMGPRNRFAGIVHGQEGVLNARAMKRVGIPNLNALNRGAPLSAVSNDNGAGGSRGDVHIHMSGPMTDRQARRTGMQAAAGFQSEQARSLKTGIIG